MLCGKCGRDNYDWSKTCGRCGTELGGSATTEVNSNTLTFAPKCPLCEGDLGVVSRPRGILTTGTSVCPNCRQQLSLRVLPSSNRLLVSALTIPRGHEGAAEGTWDARPADNAIPVQAAATAVLSTGRRFSGRRHDVSNTASKENRAGTCSDCHKTVDLLSAREECLDWDGVDAYHFYCPACFAGVRGDNYYRGRLIGADGSQIIDQHAWQY